MGDIIIGYGKPMIRIVNDQDYILPAPGKNGLWERPIFDGNVIKKRAIGGRRKYKYLGIDKEFTLSYEDFLPGFQCKKIAAICEKQMQEHQMYFYPRMMNNTYFYEVYVDNADLVLGLMRGKENAPGMKGIVMKFITVERYKVFNWKTLTDITQDYAPTGEGIDNII